MFHFKDPRLYCVLVGLMLVSGAIGEMTIRAAGWLAFGISIVVLALLTVDCTTRCVNCQRLL